MGIGEFCRRRCLHAMHEGAARPRSARHEHGDLAENGRVTG
jgi:hypothetical protein